MLSLLLLEIKTIFSCHKRIFLLSVLAFTCACIGINASMSGLLLIREEQKATEESFGNKTAFEISMDGDSDTYIRVFSNENSGKVKSLFESLANDPSFSFRYNTENLMDFFDPDDPAYNHEDFPRFKDEFRVGYETGDAVYDESYLTLKAIYADKQFCSEHGIRIEDGRPFQDADFSVDSPDKIIVPVILGQGYKDLYQVGERIENAHMGTIKPLTLEVIGFLEKGSFFYDNNAISIPLDRYMIVPSIETSYDGLLENGTYDELTHAAYDSMKIINSRILCDQDDRAEVEKRVRELFSKYGFSELRLSEESEGAKMQLHHARENLSVSILITSFVIVLITIMILISTFYRITKDRKKYSIYSLHGISFGKIALLVNVETILIFLCSAILFFVMRFLFSSVPALDFGLSRHSVLSILSIQIVLLFLIGFYGKKKVEKTDMSSVLREHD